MMESCNKKDIDGALGLLKELWDKGYSAVDIITTMFKVTKTMTTISEEKKLEFIKTIGFTHMRILDGISSHLQLSGCVAKLCKL